MTIIGLINTLDVLQQQFPTFHQLLDLSIKSIFIVLLALLTRFYFRKHSASTLSVFWLAAIISLLLLPLFSKIVPDIPILISVSQELSPTSSSESSQLLFSGQHPIMFLSGQPDLLTLIEFVYLGIAALMVGYLACGIVRMFFISQLARPHRDFRAFKILNQLKAVNGVNCQVRLLTSSRVHSPITWGIWRHRIIFPSTTHDWDEELLTHVIGHELGHIQRRDWIGFILARLTVCLYWPNPLVWMAQKNMVLEAEMACDDIATDNSKQPLVYAENLLIVASAICNNHRSLSPAMYGNGSQLELRVKHVLKADKVRGNFDFSDIFPSIFLVSVIAAPISALSLDFQIFEQIQLDRSELIPLHFFEEVDKLPPVPPTYFYHDPGIPIDNDTIPKAPLNITNIIRTITPPVEAAYPYKFATVSYPLSNNPMLNFADSSPLLIVNPQPQYPSPAKSKGIEGFVIAEYSISPSGKATNVHIVESIPSKVFDQSVIRAINQYSYHPSLAENHRATENTIRRKFVFSLAREI